MVPYAGVRDIDRAKQTLGTGHRYCLLDMENLTTTLWEEMANRHRIFLPAGSLKLHWVAVKDVAEAAAIALTQNIDGQGLTICNSESHGFAEAVDKINTICATDLTYQSPSLPVYVGHSLRQGKPLSFHPGHAAAALPTPAQPP